MDEVVTHALLRRWYLNKDGKVKRKCTAVWEDGKVIEKEGA